RMGDQCALDLKRRDPDAGDLEHVVGTAAEGVAAVDITNVFVAGAGPVAFEGRTALGALVPVALTGRGRIDQQFADLAVSHVGAGRSPCRTVVAPTDIGKVSALPRP